MSMVSRSRIIHPRETLWPEAKSPLPSTMIQFNLGVLRAVISKQLGLSNFHESFNGYTIFVLAPV